MIISWLTLVPPIAVLVLSLIFKQIMPALSAGIVIAAAIATHGSPIAAVQMILRKVYTVGTDVDNLLMFGFLPVLGTIIMLVKHTGGAQAWVQLIARRVQTRKGVELATCGFSSLFFMDDYFNSWTVGPVMQPLMDRFAIPRVKLAFFINMLAPSMAIIAPISSWIAVLLGQLEPSGISLNQHALVSSDPFKMYLIMLPFLFYPFIAIALTWFITAMGISYGPMRTAELQAETPNVGSERDHVSEDTFLTEPTSGTIWDFIIPIGLLMLLSPFMILATGGYKLFGGTHSIQEALGHADIFLALLISASITLLFTTIYYAATGKLTIRQYITLSSKGAELMTSSIMLLFLAFVFGNFLRTELPAGTYLATTGISGLPLPLLPVIFYALAAGSASTVGSAWGTMMVLIPMAVPMVVTLYHVATPADPAQLLLLAPTLGAILSGAVVGAHVSPIADNVIVSSLATGSDHLTHVRAQVPYVIPGVIGAGIAYLIAGFAVPAFPHTGWLIALATGMVITFAILLGLNRRR